MLSSAATCWLQLSLLQFLYYLFCFIVIFYSFKLLFHDAIFRQKYNNYKIYLPRMYMIFFLVDFYSENLNPSGLKKSHRKQEVNE